MKKVWIVTSEYNDYDQHGEYFVAVFLLKPTFKELKKTLGLDKITTQNLTKGGGRQNTENIWYNLKEVKLGVSY